MRHHLGLATRTPISVCKSPFPSAGTAVSLFYLKISTVCVVYRKHATVGNGTKVVLCVIVHRIKRDLACVVWSF